MTSRAPAQAPVWLLDVDGVLNAQDPGWDQPPVHGRAVVDGVTYQLRWSPTVVGYLHGVHRAGSAEIRWATTWADNVAQLEELLHLPPFKTAFSGLGQAPSVKAPELKLTSALQVVEIERRPLIWTDDDAIPDHGPLRERLESAGVPVLFLAPDSLHGLQPEHLALIDAFLGRS